VPGEWGLHFGDMSIGSIATGKLNKAQIKNLKLYQIEFELRSAIVHIEVYYGY
jgi:hypothetical protein